LIKPDLFKYLPITKLKINKIQPDKRSAHNNVQDVFIFAPFFNLFIQHHTVKFIMGRGDVKSRRGKIRRKSHGNTRLKLKKLKTLAKQAAAKSE
jgi:ribosomal small subunit protein bTHX